MHDVFFLKNVKFIKKPKCFAMKKITMLLLACSAMGYSQCITDVQSGEHFGIILKDDGTISTWGNGLSTWGFLGLGPVGDINTPTQVGDATNWHTIFTGAFNSFGIKNNGTLWGAGNNETGELGIGSSGSGNVSLVFVQAGTATNWKAVSGNRQHTIATRTDGTLWAWGSNQSGKLGIGNLDDKYVPTQIGTGTNWDKVSTNLHTSYAIKTDGTMWSWGSNGSGALGQPFSDALSSPGQIGTDTDWEMIAGAKGGLHALALKTDGSLFIFGGTWSTGTGALGLGPDFEQGSMPLPTQIGTAEWAFVAAGYNSSYAVKTNGTLWAWGQNDKGQLGDGTTVDKNVPVQVGTATDWAYVAAGMNHAYGVKTNGDLYAWGDNSLSQLGTGNTVSTTTPALVYSCVGTVIAGTTAFVQVEAQMVPNPAQNNISIIFESAVEADTAEVFDLAGRSVIKTNVMPVNNSITLDVSHLANGMYNVVIKNNNGVVLSKKLIKN